jgi:hypothetical protein
MKILFDAILAALNDRKCFLRFWNCDYDGRDYSGGLHLLKLEFYFVPGTRAQAIIKALGEL